MIAFINSTRTCYKLRLRPTQSTTSLCPQWTTSVTPTSTPTIASMSLYAGHLICTCYSHFPVSLSPFSSLPPPPGIQPQYCGHVPGKLQPSWRNRSFRNKRNRKYLRRSSGIFRNWPHAFGLQWVSGFQYNSPGLLSGKRRLSYYSKTITS